jgi:hypothetical protein
MDACQALNATRTTRTFHAQLRTRLILMRDFTDAGSPVSIIHCLRDLISSPAAREMIRSTPLTGSAASSTETRSATQTYPSMMEAAARKRDIAAIVTCKFHTRDKQRRRLTIDIVTVASDAGQDVITRMEYPLPVPLASPQLK